jgi:hypothetical protein
MKKRTKESKAARRARERAAEVEQVKKVKGRPVGRPLNGQNAAPWIELGLSRRTFFRRKKAGEGAAPMKKRTKESKAVRRARERAADLALERAVWPR